jgi:hypothetical protein
MVKVRIGLGAAEIIDRDRDQIVATALDHRAQHQAADTSEAVDGDFHGHGSVSFLCSPAATDAPPAHRH